MKLDNLDKIKKLDPGGVYASIEDLPNQCLDAFRQVSKVSVPKKYKRNIDNIVMTGMGGSGLGARIIESVYGESLRLPLVRVNDYHLPGFVNQKTLVICSSYSGTTEETLENARKATALGAKWLAIGTGKTLITMAKSQGVPYYQINPVENPSSQPRMAIGYSVIGQLVLASKIGLFDLEEKDILIMIDAMKDIQMTCSLNVPTQKNPAKKLAKQMFKKIVFFVSSHHLVGAMHTVNNQLNENAKVASSDFIIPELNHHLMEGLKYPQTNKKNLFLFLVNSDLYDERISKRLAVTEEVINKNQIPSFSFKVKSATKLAQAMELTQFGSFVCFYLAMLYNQDPSPIPWVDYFKKRLAK